MRNKKIYPLILLLSIFSIGAYAQSSNAILFTENGEKFTLILNGLRQNEQPETNVKVEGLNAEFYKMKVIFDNAALGEKAFNLYLEKGMEISYSIRQNKKNEYVLRPVSSVPIAEAPPTPASTQVVTYNPNAPVYTPTETVTQQTTTTTTTNGTPAGGISMGINVSETGGGVSMNVSGFDNTGSTTQQTTTVTTTTTTSSSQYNEPAPQSQQYLPGYEGSVGCPVPMNPGDFKALKQSINSKSFEESKLTMAKQVLNHNCLFADQVKEILMLFTFEESKLDIAKYAYTRTYDVGNYFKVNDAFTFESSIEELNEYIQGVR